MSCTRNLVLAHLEAWFDAKLKERFSQQSIATRSISKDPSGTVPLATPSLWMIETGSTLFSDNQYWSDMEVDVSCVCSIKANKALAGKIQYLINEAEAALDECLKASFTTNEHVQYTVRPAGFRPCYPGTTGQGQLEYPIKIRFTRQEVM